MFFHFLDELITWNLKNQEKKLFLKCHAGRTEKKEMSGEELGKTLWRRGLCIFPRERPLMAHPSGRDRVLLAKLNFKSHTDYRFGFSSGAGSESSSTTITSVPNFW